MNLLLIEDNPVERKLVEAVVSRVKDRPFTLQSVDSLTLGLAWLASHQVDCILLDLNLPDTTGIDTYRSVAAAAPAVPVVVLTVIHDEALAIQAVSEGAQDYLFKAQAEGALLVRSVRYAVERQRMKAELESYTRRLGEHVRLLNEGFTRLAAGDLRVRIGGSSDGHDELAALAAGFDRTVEQLRRLREQKAQFYSMVTHDLRSPVHTILLASSSLQMMRADEPGRISVLGVVQRKASQLAQLVDELMEVMFIEAGQMKLLPTRTDLNALLSTCIEDLEPQARARGQRIALEPLDGEATLVCDSLKLYRVAENLLGNAIRHSREGDRIEVRASEPRAGWLRVEVADNGPGVDESVRDMLVEPFSKGWSASERPASPPTETRTGLGLGICGAFVRAHSGQVGVESERGQGARFWFEVPRKPPGEQRPSADSPDEVRL
ncbi:MAG: hybrid sensor histidine kinase/response regulator [Candidatus Wallbacteria bacterium]|nr:hybrid sensor histidine kinase/response regulator [Candidatus Wallbacteria bacterium]